jgi:prephenate dehydrogenase
LKARGNSTRVTGVDARPDHARRALQRGLVDDIADLAEALPSAGLVILAVPVDAAATLLPRVLDCVPAGAVVTDAGSVKLPMARAAAGHRRRGRYVGSHPIAGTEYSGPDAAQPGLFAGRVCLLCDTESCDGDALEAVRGMYAAAGMRVLTMDAESHDRHAAYVSHLSHISSFVLARTVLEIEKSSAAIADLAGSGLASTVRLAKSAPRTWTSIFVENAASIAGALDAYRKNLADFQRMIAEGDEQGLYEAMTQANDIGRVLEGLDAQGRRAGPGEIPPDHGITRKEKST